MMDKFEQMIETECQKAYDLMFRAVGQFTNSFMAGGCIASIALGEKVNDWDIWFESVEAWEAAALLVRTNADYHVTPANGGFTGQPNPAGTIKILAQTDHAITFRLLPLVEGEPVYQIVKSRAGDPQDVVEQFDFLHAQAAYFPREEGDTCGTLEFFGRNCVDFIRERILVFAGQLDYPIHTLSRIGKFASRGYTVPDSTLADLVMAIRDATPELIGRDLVAAGRKYNGGKNTMTYTGEALLKSEKPAGLTDFSKPSDDFEEGLDF